MFGSDYRPRHNFNVGARQSACTYKKYATRAGRADLNKEQHMPVRKKPKGVIDREELNKIGKHKWKFLRFDMGSDADHGDALVMWATFQQLPREMGGCRLFVPKRAAKADVL